MGKINSLEEVDNKPLVPFTWSDFQNAVDSLALQLKERNIESSFECIYGIPRGGLVLAVALSHRLNKPLLLDSQRLFNLTLAKGKVALIVDDICDSGDTLSRWSKLAKFTATIHYVENTKHTPSLWVVRKEARLWIQYPWETVSTSR